MRKVVTGAFISMDGVMQAPGGPHEDPTGGFEFGGWVWPYADEVSGRAIGDLFRQPFDLLLGRKTYEIFAAYWPFVEGGEHNSIAKAFNKVTKYVATRSNMELTWKGSVALHDAAADVARLKKEDGPILLTQGSTDLLQTLFKQGLIDEIRTFTYPIILGKGKKLFGGDVPPAAFKLIDSKISPNGIVIARYERAGEVQTRDMGMDPPPPEEVARREKMQREG